MPTDLPLARHLDGMRAAVVDLSRYAERAGLRAPVPTTPDWTVRRLVAHQGMVHRWATSVVRGVPAEPTAYEEEGRSSPDPVEWLRDGAVGLAQALHEAPDDLRVVVFLEDAPSPKRFWARRQCHETTMHAVDALSAALGRYPRAADTDLPDDLALDGIDELLRGFLTRERSRLRCADPVTIAVRPDGPHRSWLLELGGGPAVTTCLPAPGTGDARDATLPTGPSEALPEPDVVLTGSPVALYLSLWNRSDEVEVADCWRGRSAVRWD